MSAHGVPTATLTIFINMLSKYICLIEPTHVALMWDDGHAFRDEIYPEYKAARKKHEPGSEDTLPFSQAKMFLACAGVLHLQAEGWEADDLIAVAARQIHDDVAILSGDKDLLQLVRGADNLYGLGPVVQYRLPDDEPWDEDKVYAKFGCAPEHLPLYLALVGDVSDGVPGVRGIGPKKALKALEEAGWDWDRLLASLTPEQAHTARTMRSLVDLRHMEYPEHLQIFDDLLPPFEPVGPHLPDHWRTLVDFLDRHELKTIKERLVAGTLWSSPSAQNPVREGAFDSFLDEVGSLRGGIGTSSRHPGEVLDDPKSPA